MRGRGVGRGAPASHGLYRPGGGLDTQAGNLSLGPALLFLGLAPEHRLLLASPTLHRSPLRNFAPDMLSSCGGEAGRYLGPSPARAALHKRLLDEGTGHRGSPAPSGVAGPPGRTPLAPAPRVSQTPLVVGLVFPAVCSGTVETIAGRGPLWDGPELTLYMFI